MIVGWVLGSSLDANLLACRGILSAALWAKDAGYKLICPENNGAEAAWVPDLAILSAKTLWTLTSHLRGSNANATQSHVGRRVLSQVLTWPMSRDMKVPSGFRAASGGHNLLMSGPPGAGKSYSLLFTGLLPPLNPQEALDVTRIHSLAGTLKGKLIRQRPFVGPITLPAWLPLWGVV